MAKKTTVDWRQLRKKLQAYPTIVKREMDIVMAQEERNFIKTVVSITPPGSKGVTGKAAQRQGERTIDRDLGEIFQPVVLVRKRKLTHYFGNPLATPIYVKAPEIYPDPKSIYEYRKGRRRNGKITRGQKAPYYVSKPKVDALARDLYKQVGILASGYNDAAIKVKLKLPAWIARHGTGRGSYTPKEGSLFRLVTISNQVPYAGTLGMQRIADSTSVIQNNKLQRRMPYVLRGILKKARFETR